jgi:glycosyltransferase involved in cell wall biosynthesis
VVKVPFWRPHSRLFVVGDRSADWSIADDARRLERTARELGAKIGPARLGPHAGGQAVFYASQFVLLDGGGGWPRSRLGLAYLHGRPGTPGFPEFDRCFATFRRRHGELARVQVSHSELHELVLETGIDAARVFRIPIGVDTAAFAPGRGTRTELGIPESAFTVGSLLKDGVGMAEGLEPKLIKGPDTLLRTLELLKPRVPELLVLLTGPARGFVKAGLERLGIPYRHLSVEAGDVPRVYRALDVCLVTSRQEGGPKAVLEAMASGVPLVTTRVGQAMDLVRNGENGFLADVEDAEGLADEVARIHGGSDVGPLLEAARLTAEAHSHEALRPRWRDLLTGFVELP